MATLMFIILLFIQYGYCLSGVIWNIELNKFVPIFDISPFNGMQKEAIKKSYEKENHNFNKQPIRLLFHEDAGIITVHDNDKRVTGFFGEIWTFLSEYANFTLVIKKVPEKRIGIRTTFKTGYNGLLRYIEYEEADIIAKIEVFEYWSDIVDFFLPLWNDRYRLFVQLSYKENTYWIAHLYTYDVWLAIAAFYVLFLTASAFDNICTAKYCEEKYSKFDYKDYLFYFHGVFCQRSFFLFCYQKTCSILNSCACLYSMLILNFYCAKILSVMLNKTPFEPFDGLDSLHRKTDYFVISEKDSVAHMTFEFLQINEDIEPDHELRNIIKSKRIMFPTTRDRMYTIGCTSEKKYALLESENLKENVEKYGCIFKPLGKAYFHTWVTGGVKKNFTYKRTIDLGILKLLESGLLTALKHRLIGLDKSQERNMFDPISLEKVYVIIAIFALGIIKSIIILFIEIIVSYLKNK